MKLLLPLATLLLLSPIIQGANVIMFLTMISKSMKNIFLPLAKEMVNRGHNVTLVTPFLSKTASPGIREIILYGLKEIIEANAVAYAPGKDSVPLYSFAVLPELTAAIQGACEFIFGNSEIQDILAGKEKYDLVVLNLLYEDCGLGIAKKLDLPFLYVSSYGIPVEHANNLRIPSCMPYCPIFSMHDYTNKMTFMERLKNSFTTLAITVQREWFCAPAADEIIRKRLGDLPPVLDIERNVSVIIVNDHFSITYARPVLPNIVQAACMHCTPAKPLTEELKEWVEGSGNEGFIYFSLGSLVPAHLMPKKLLEAFVNVFSELKQRVVWKIDLDEIPNLSKNVKLFKWLPQQDLLGHPKLRLFMTHGGLLSVQEAAYHGVPMLGFPASIDQPYNMRVVEQSGSGILMNWKEINTKSLRAAMDQIMKNPLYKKNAEIRRSLTRDLQNTPLDTAVYWIEYVLRHNGAPQLRTGGLALKWYQYYQVDMLVFLIVLQILCLLIMFSLWRICRKVCRKKQQKKGLKKD